MNICIQVFHRPMFSFLLNRYLGVKLMGYLVAQTVKNLSAMQETWVPLLGQEYALEKGMATCSGILAWEIPWTEEPEGLQSMGSQRVRHHWVTKHACIVCIFNLRNCQSIFQSSCTILYSYQLCGRILISVHHHQHLIFSVFPLAAVIVSA